MTGYEKEKNSDGLIYDRYYNRRFDSSKIGQIK